MMLYFIKSTFLLLIFCLIYKWNLENKKSLQFIRYYLLTSIAFALVVPLFSFQFLVPQNKIVETKEYIFNQLPNIPVIIVDNVPESNISILTIIYVFVSGVFLIRFLYSLFNILKIKKSGRKEHTSFGNLIVSNNVTSPFTFCNYIYVNKTEWENKSVNPAILYHEQAHVKQKHSIDILFVEALKIVMWFQPFLYYFKRIVQENHEYLADEFSLQRTKNLKNYQELILNYYGNNQPIVALSSSIHFNNLKKRFIMMKNTNKGKVWGTIFYSLTIAVTYVGFVGIEAKATEIKKVESVLEEKFEKKSQSIRENDTESQKVVRKLGSDSDAAKKIEYSQKDSIVLIKFKKEQNYTDVFVHPTTKDVYLYLVSPDQSSVLVRNMSKKETILTDISKHNIHFKLIEKKSDEIHSVLEKKATPKEGLAAFMQNFAREFKAPKEISSDQIKFRLKFIVETDGSFSNIFAVDGDENVTTEAIRVLETMPNWNPAEHEGQVVRSTFTLPITIRVNPKIDVVN